jgi:small subunit ribosomal protein S2
MESQLARELKKIHRNLNGVRSMTRLPGALVAIDTNRETNALREAKNLGIPTVCLIDTDGDPDFADIPIPGNDDSMRSIDIIVRELCGAVTEGKTQRQTSSPEEAGEADASAAPAPRKRSMRSRFRMDETVAAGEGASDAAPGAEPTAG